MNQKKKRKEFAPVLSRFNSTNICSTSVLEHKLHDIMV